MPPFERPGGTPESELELARRVAAGDEAAFERIFRAYYAPLCRYVDARLRAAEESEELVQTLFTRLWERRERWTVRESLAAYLYRAARNELADRLRRRRRERRLRRPDVRPALAPAELPAPDAELEAGEEAERVRAAIRGLPPRARQAVELRWYHGLRYAEIAEVMGISSKGVEVQLARALRALRDVLAR